MEGAKESKIFGFSEYSGHPDQEQARNPRAALPVCLTLRIYLRPSWEMIKKKKNVSGSYGDDNVQNSLYLCCGVSTASRYHSPLCPSFLTHIMF